ncbi:hypothetical protein M7I_1441 [Glarea lozoyensis 74030]|uniref:Uncharacterized protein n=1 Tax=Glarea lozoyensis (strain ATCC 74030 / MF5533) TaxID=1104152 RepID=H0EG33_GLAL7|nr:hypothetical protein M7I_1441 [Glarea lozoyensis 74030]
MIARTKSEGKRAAKASKFTVIGNPETILPKVAPESKSQHYGPIVTSTKENADSVPTPSRPSHAVKFATTYQRPSVTEPLESSTKENQESAPNHKAHDLDRKFDGEAEEPFDCHTPVAVEPVKTFQDPSLEARTMVLPDTPLARILPHHEQDIDSSSLPIPTITREPPEKLGHSSINTLTPSLVQYVPTKPSGIYLTRPLKPPTASIFNTSAGLNIEKELLTFADINGRTLESKDIEIPIVLPPIALDRAQVPLRKGEPPVDENSLTLIPSQDTKTRENSEAEDSDANSFVTASAYWTPLEDLAKELDIDKLVEKVEALAIDAQEYPDELPEPVLIDPKPHSIWGKFGAFKGKEKDKTPDEGILKGGSKKESGEAIQQPGDKDDWEFRGPITTKKKKKKKKKKKTILEGATVEDVQEDIYCEAEDNSEEIEETRGLGAAENKKKMKDDNLESPSIEKPRSLTPSSAVDYWKTTTLISDSHPKRTPMDEDMGVYEDPLATNFTPTK